MWRLFRARARDSQARYFKSESIPTEFEVPGQAATHLGFSEPTFVVFLNDVLFRAADIAELVLTNGGLYDLACAMDFDGFKLYDEWVARDLAGQTLSPWYPFVRDPDAQARLRAGQPFRLYSCWNGAVALPASAIRLFRSWREDEPPSVDALDPNAAVLSPTQQPLQRCPVSECALVCKDLWQAGRTRIYMNPRVRLVYDSQSFVFVTAALPLT